MKYEEEDVIVLFPDIYLPKVYWGQPLEIIYQIRGVYCCKCSEDHTWWIAEEEIKGYFQNEIL